jgi:hypothetical protein
MKPQAAWAPADWSTTESPAAIRDVDACAVEGAKRPGSGPRSDAISTATRVLRTHNFTVAVTLADLHKSDCSM